jgi:hypothetical protein
VISSNDANPIVSRFIACTHIILRLFVPATVSPVLNDLSERL